MMKILVATPYLPWPLNSGANAAQFSTLKCLEHDHEFTLVCPVYENSGMDSAQELQTLLPNVKIRAIYCGSPPPTQQANPQPAGIILRAARWTVRHGRRFLSPPPAATPNIPPSASSEATAEPYYPVKPLPKQLIAALVEEVSQGVDLFQAELVDMLPLGTWLSPDLPKLFIHHEIHFVYLERFLETRGHDDYQVFLKTMWKTRELACLRTFHGIVTFSDTDRKILQPLLPDTPVFSSPFPVPADVGISREPPETSDEQFLFLATGDHKPNVDALEWLVAEVWPEIIRQLPSASLLVIGNWGEAVKSRLNVPGITFAGFVKDLASTLRGGIMLVPLRIGSGIRVKIMVAMAQGVPVVSTTVGCEGMPVTDGVNILIRDDPGEFAAAAVTLSQNPVLRKSLANAAIHVVADNYSAEAVRIRRNEIYAMVLQSAQATS